MAPHETILAVGGDSVDIVAPLLEESPYRIERVRDGRTAVMLARKMRFQHLVVSFPLSDLSLAEFAEHLRQPDSASPTARLLLVARDEHLAEAASYRDEGLIAAAVSLDLDAEELVDAVISFMKTAPRVSVALPVRMQPAAGPSEPIDGVTVNLSETGALVRCPGGLPLRAKVRLELLPRRGDQPIRAQAVVVRKALPEAEGFHGLGLRFVGFHDDGHARLAVQIRGILAEFVG